MGSSLSFGVRCCCAYRPAKGGGTRFVSRSAPVSVLEETMSCSSLLKSLLAEGILNKTQGVFMVFLRSPVSSQEPAPCPTQLQKIHKSKRCRGHF